jgi:hypothetical protein
MAAVPIPILQSVIESSAFAFTATTYGEMKKLLLVREDFLSLFKRVALKHFTELSLEQLQDFTKYLDDDDLPEASDVVLSSLVRVRRKQAASIGTDGL